jgi:plastocyanin
VEVLRAGYQPYRSWNLLDDNGTIAQDVDLTPDIAGTPAYTITITDEGFEPSYLKVTPGSIIAWVNASLNEHTATGDVFDSGVLDAGQVYRTALTAPGTHTYTDAANPLNAAVVVVNTNRVYLPIVLR